MGKLKSVGKLFEGRHFDRELVTSMRLKSTCRHGRASSVRIDQVKRVADDARKRSMPPS
jgi:hypothetical protein